MVKSLGAGITGLAGLTSMDAVRGGSESPSIKEITNNPRWTHNVPVQSWNVVNAIVSVGYYGSEFGHQWVNGELKERWKHAFEVITIGQAGDDSDEYYNIDSQSFKAVMKDATEHHSHASAGAAAWPDPQGGNWSAVTEELVENSLSELSSIVGVGLVANAILQAYNSKGFDNNKDNTIKFSSDYSSWTRTKASHGVQLFAFQPPNTKGKVNITGSIGDAAAGPVEGTIKVLIDSSQTDGSIGSNTVTSSSGTPTLSKERLKNIDSMSEKELAKYGIKRVNPSELSEKTRRNSRFDFSGSGPTYITVFDTHVEHEVDGGTVAKS